MSDHEITSAVASDGEIIEIVEAITARLNRGESLDVQDLASKYPAHASQLSDLIPTLQAIALLAHSPSPSEASCQPVASSGLASPSLSAGRLGEYRIIREIGRGGMGVVYEAEQQSLARRVALKVFPFASIMEQRQLQRFLNEARAAAMLKHPNIVNVLSVGCELGVHYYAMQLVEGQSLAQVIEGLRNLDGGLRDGGLRHRPLKPDTECSEIPRGDPVTDTLAIAALSTEFSDHRRRYGQSVAAIAVRVAEALHHAHGEGVIHRDIKPSNLMIDRDGKPWITDFGLAQTRSGAELTMSGDLLGTLRYMSPEQARGRAAVDERTDIYSLGMTLYELLTLRHAFDEVDRAALVHAVIDKHPPPPRKLDPSIPADLETIVLKAISKRPDDRYQSCQQLADDLQRFLDRKPIVARRVSRSEHAWRWAGRNPVISTLSVAVVLLVLVLAIGGPLVAIKQTRLASRLTEAVYDAQMGVAHAALNNGEFERVDTILRQFLPTADQDDLRGFEWYYLRYECRQALSVPTLPGAWPVHCVEYSPDGRYLAAAGFSSRITLLDATSRESVWDCRLDGNGDSMGPVDAMAFSPDSQLLATGGRDGLLRIWDVGTGEHLLTRDDLPFISALAFSPKGNILVTGFARNESDWGQPVEIGLWKVTRGSTTQSAGVQLAELPFLSGPVSRVDAVTFSADGALLAAGSSDGRVYVWDFATREMLAQMPMEGEMVSDVVFSPTSPELLAVVSGSPDTSRRGDRGVSLWNVQQQRAMGRLWGATSGVRTIAFSPDGQYIVAAGYEQRVQLWDLETYEPVRTLGRHSGLIRDVAFAPDGSTVATASTDNTVKLWRLDDPMLPARLEGHRGPALGLAISGDSRLLLSASADATARLWDLKTGMQLKKIPSNVGELMAAAISPDGRTIALGGGRYEQADEPVEFFLWDTMGDRRLHTLWSSTGREIGSTHIFAAAFSPDGCQVAATIGKSVKIWDVDSGQPLEDLWPHSSTVSRLAWSPRGNIIASVTVGPELKLWDANTGECLATLDSPQRNYLAVAFSPDGQTLAAAGTENGDISLFDVSARRHLGELRGHTDTVLGLDFSPDGQRLASSSNGSVKIWNLKTGKDILTFHEPVAWSWSVRFAPDGSALCATDNQIQNAQIYVWRAAGRETVQNDVHTLKRRLLLHEDREPVW